MSEDTGTPETAAQRRVALTNFERSILSVLDEECGLTTGWVRKTAFPNPPASWAPHVRGTLLLLERMGLVRPMDGGKPVVWCRTEAGTTEHWR